MINSKFFGNITFTNATGVLKNDIFQVMNYDPETNRIYFEFESYPHYLDFKGWHMLNVTVTDKRGAYSTYHPNVTIDGFVDKGNYAHIVTKSYATSNSTWYAWIDSIDS